MLFSIFLFFLLSGFCSLLYQVVWLRLAFAHFGVITPVISIVLSTFMLGLALGCWGAARLVEKRGASSLRWYAGAEAVIGSGAFAVPWLFTWGEKALLITGASNSTAFLFQSGLVIAGAILPWCVAMGATLPFMMAFLEQRTEKSSASFSFLYLANVIGATIGVLVTAGVLVELMGFKNTLRLAGGVNFLLSLGALVMGWWMEKGENNQVTTHREEILTARENKESLLWGSALLFTTGFVSIGIEVALTRVYTPIIGTTVYAFALVLALYLLATSLGSLFYRGVLKFWRPIHPEFSVALLPVAVLLTVITGDVRMMVSGARSVLGSLPLFFLLGFLTPAVIDQAAQGSTRIAGALYAISAWGCILGPLVTGYFLLPVLGAKFAIIVLAIPFFCFFLGR